MHNVLTYILGERERERGSIIQHRLFDGFSLEVCGPSGFSSLTLLYSPLLILLTLSLSPIGRQVFLGAFNASVVSNAVYICVFCKQQASSGQLLILYRDVLRNLLCIVCVIEGGAEEMGESQITCNEANII